MFLEILNSLLIIAGSFFTFVGSLGLLKLPDIYTRLHGPTKAGTLGIGLVLLASTIYFSDILGHLSIIQVMVAIFLLLTAPISAHIIAKAALHKKNAATEKTVFNAEEIN